jgi:hypothetical protein
MTCNGKAISKVMGWGMLLNVIRDKNRTQETGEGCRTDRECWVFWWFDVVEWRVRSQ